MAYIIKVSLLLSMLIGLMNTASAADVRLLTVTNDDDENVYYIGLITNEDTDEVVKMYKKEFDKKKKLIDEIIFTPKELEGGVTIVKRSGFDIVKLDASHVNPSDSADIEMTVLKHALKKKELKYDLDVERVGRDWIIKFEKNKASHLHFKINKKALIGAVGVKEVKLVK